MGRQEMRDVGCEEPVDEVPAVEVAFGGGRVDELGWIALVVEFPVGGGVFKGEVEALQYAPQRRRAHVNLAVDVAQISRTPGPIYLTPAIKVALPLVASVLIVGVFSVGVVVGPAISVGVFEFG